MDGAAAAGAGAVASGAAASSTAAFTAASNAVLSAAAAAVRFASALAVARFFAARPSLGADAYFLGAKTLRDDGSIAAAASKDSRAPRSSRMA